MSPPAQPAPVSPVSVSLHDLQSGQIPHSTLLSAFGPSSLGILVVTDLPPSFPSLRHTVLSNSSRLAAFPSSALASLTNAPAKYLVGWSHGKETLRPGVVDTLKGSYYINCAFYQDPALQGADKEKHPGFEEYTADNVWPNEERGDVPGFRAAAEELISLIIDTAVLVARACDQFAESEIDGYAPGYLERVVRTSTTTKARLLHYFPAEVPERNGDAHTSDDTSEDDWCATHLDHGCLTGLTSAMFIDESLPANSDALTPSADSPPAPLTELPSSPDPLSGLYIRSRTSTVVKVNIPRDALAFQTGEALELITQGRFKAVPHFVRGARPSKEMRLARNTLAVFTQPNLDEVVDVQSGKTFGEFAHGIVANNTTKG